MPLLDETASASLLPASTRLGEVHLSVTDADKALAVWRDVVGLPLIARSGDELRLGPGGRTLIVLHADATGPVVHHTTGLYHVAIHVPTRRDLAHFVARAAEAGLRIAPTDHLVTEAVYAWDADGNGIEMTFETPWRGTLGNPDEGAYGTTTDGRPHSGREPIDLDDLMAETAGDKAIETELPAGTRIGHVHVHVTDLDASMRFYRDRIGFAGLFILRQWGMGDAGLGYPPHAIAFNIWAGAGARPAPQGAAGLKYFTLEVPDLAARNAIEERLRAAGSLVEHIGDTLETADPSQNRLRIVLTT